MTVFPRQQRRTRFVNSTAKRHQEEVRGGPLTLTNHISAFASLKSRYQGCSYDSLVSAATTGSDSLHCVSVYVPLPTKLLFLPSFLTLKC